MRAILLKLWLMILPMLAMGQVCDARDVFANDLNKSKELRDYTKSSDQAQDAWFYLYESGLNVDKRTDINELTLVSKNLEAIKSAKGNLNWKALQGAGKLVRSSISEVTQFAKDPKTLEKLAEYLSVSNSSKLQAIGGEQGLINFLKKNKDVPCATCGTGGIAVFAGRNMDEMIENFVEVAYLYKDHPQLWSKLAQGAEHTLPAMREGTQHTLEIIRKSSSKYHPSRIESMDLRFEDLPSDIDFCVNCRYDIKFKTNAVGNGTPLFAEFKSYARSTWNNIATDTKFFSQFKNYISSVNKIDDLAYIINTKKASIDEVKTAFKAILTNNKTEVFNAMTPDLRASLKLDGIDAQIKFNQLINNVDSDLYKFIKAE